jgi:hypothetical protein
MTEKTPTLDVYGELQMAFDHYNEELFVPAGQPLPQCIMTLQRKARTSGYFSRDAFTNRDSGTTVHELAVNPQYFSITPLIETLQTLVHEMTHMWEREYGDPPQRYHSKDWADKMESLGLMPSDTGMPGGKKTGQKMGDYVIDGGKFMQATERLLAKNFKFPWADSHVSVPQEGEQTYVPESWAEYMPEEGTPMAELEEGGLAATVATLYQSTVPLHLVISGKPSRTRQKFVCPECHDAAWGKPSLNFACLKHGLPVSLVAIEG